ncbi:MAG TPA: helix-turn-helix domain-containing protein [Acidimicrobiales bacterium]|nr:helix-turn-helix domain-containing protein [Acidimicrobiales bacterium]
MAGWRAGSRTGGVPGGVPGGARRGRGPQAIARYQRARTAIMIGSAVRAARRRAGISQAELARRALTSQPAIARLERGQVSPTVASLDRIARALGTELVVDFEPVGEAATEG